MSEDRYAFVDRHDSFFQTPWFDHCRTHRLPFVVIRTGGTSSDVLWDFITLPPTTDARLRDDHDTLEHQARVIFERYAAGESYLRVKPTQIGFDRLPAARAPQAASELYALIAGYLPTAEAPLVEVTIPLPLPQPFRGDTPKASNVRRLWVEQCETSSAA